MHRTSFLLTTAILLTAVHGQDGLVGRGWKIELIAEQGTKPEVRVDSQGRPHIAYMIEAFQGHLFHTMKDGGTWATDTIRNGYFYAPLYMVLDDEDRVHIAYHDHSTTAGDVVYTTGSGVDWTREFVGSLGHDGWDGRIALGPADELHVVSIDPDLGGTGAGIEWATQRDGQWVVEEIGSGKIPYEFGVAIAVGVDGRLHVVYHDGDEFLNTSGDGADLLYATLNGGEWQIETVDSRGDVGKFPSLALDSAGRPHLTYLEWTAEHSAIVKYAFHDGSSCNSRSSTSYTISRSPSSEPAGQPPLPSTVATTPTPPTRTARCCDSAAEQTTAGPTKT